ncbi:unnamed protein product [Rotaria socialis]|uniref:Calcium uniporter protein n=3 Tax=Rotaria socialis TaxID=392032 RepID=A0A821RNG3_9BILA|nr:unnamed protein product [Rotaria socialis]CAF3309749.1 unnamed protein product [Rotaria socialis]CAF3574784.1 unnamed protein product [Rotaria socialis]CAF3622548.1 unnamed protein product [Rotaria socialis]CAF3676320.1 unnamed protein product [Rotaria socialis]
MFSCTVRLTSLLRSAINVPTSSKLLQTILVKNNSTNTIPEPTISYSDSALVLSLILPSRQETCRFHLNLHTTTVGQLIDEIQQEDAGIEHVQIFDKKGTLFSKSCGMSSLIQSPFTIQLNRQRTYLFDPINKLQIKDTIVRQSTTDSSSIEDTVATLYYALNVMKIYHVKYAELKAEADTLTTQLEPLEKMKNKLANKCQRYTSRCIWYGLAAMSFQVGALAELTWDVYSWDIVEPISYFVAYGSVIAVYAFYLMTRSDFEYLTWSDRLFLRQFYRVAHRHGFDISLYNDLKNRLFLVNTDLARLRAPLSFSLPVPPHPFICKVSGDEISPLDIYRTTTKAEQ